MRITAQLINAVTGFHLWSKTYDRDLGDVLKLQTEIATAVASALKVTLLGDVAAKVELGGTRNPAAFDAYLRAAKVYRGALDERSLRDSIARYSEAIQLDPDYAIAYANRSIARFGLARNWAMGDSVRDYRESAQADARKAILLVLISPRATWRWPLCSRAHWSLGARIRNTGGRWRWHQAMQNY